MTEQNLLTARTVSHRGKSLRLSLPTNDPRQDYTTAKDTFCARSNLQEVERRDSLLGTDIQEDLCTPLQTQSIDIYPDLCDEKDMRVVCSVADRIQWEQKVRQVRERRLRELGVGLVSNTPYNEPIILMEKPKDTWRPTANPKAPVLTGLHTPATSTATTTDSAYLPRERHLSTLSILSKRLKGSDSIDPASLSASMETLREKKHQLATSITTMIRQDQQHAHGRSLSQRELVHRRLNSILPVRVRSCSARVVSDIGSIREETEALEQAESPAAYGPIGSQATFPIATNPFKLHQHLASHDLSELIKVRPVPRQCLEGDVFLPDLVPTYETFDWGDTSMDSIGNAPMFLPSIPIALYPGATDSLMPPPSFTDGAFMFSNSNELVLPQHSSNHFVQAFEQFPQMPLDSLSSSAPFMLQDPRQPSLNLDAQTFVPFAHDIVKPDTKSHAIPIIRPEDGETRFTSPVVVDRVTSDENTDRGIMVSSSSKQYDAYDGFNSGSESESESGADETVEHDEGHTTNGSSSEDSDLNEERVKSFRFPSPVKTTPTAPTLSRTGLFNSPSPDGSKTRPLTSLPPPMISSTPRKSPRIFQKSVALEDNELDSIIMDLSIRERHSEDRDDETCSSDESSVDGHNESLSRPSLRRTSSAKLLLSHKDADMGLLLDAMLSAKFAAVTDGLATLQSSVATMQGRLRELPAKVEADSASELVSMLRRECPALQHGNKAIIDLSEQLSQNGRYLETVIDSETALKAEVESLRVSLQEAHSKIESQDSDQRSSATWQQHQAQSSEFITGMIEAREAELTAKASRLQGQLEESTTFCSALQSQYSAAELALTKLRRELSDAVCARDEAVARMEEAYEKYGQLQDHLQESACDIAEEQSRWRESIAVKDARIDQLERHIGEQQELHGESHRRTSTVSTMTTSNDAQLIQYLGDRVKALELSNQNLHKTHQHDLQAREQRFESLLSEWKEMTKQVISLEATTDGLRAEIVINAEVEDRLMAELQRSQMIVDTLSAQLRKSGPPSILKRSKSDIETRADQVADQAILSLTTQLNEKDARIAQLEALLAGPPDSTERQILSAVSENITSPPPKPESLKANISELRRMRLSWEVKHAPALAMTSRPSVLTGSSV